MSVFKRKNALFFVCSSMFPGHFVKFRRLGLPTRGFRLESIAKVDFSWKSFLMNFGIDLHRFLKALGTVFPIF